MRGVGPMAAPFTLTLALSHRGRGDCRWFTLTLALSHRGRGDCRWFTLTRDPLLISPWKGEGMVVGGRGDCWWFTLTRDPLLISPWEREGKVVGGRGDHSYARRGARVLRCEGVW